jgi:hypothetical protein
MENEFVYNNHVRIIIRVKLAYLCKQPDKIFEKSLRNRHNPNPRTLLTVHAHLTSGKCRTVDPTNFQSSFNNDSKCGGEEAAETVRVN